MNAKMRLPHKENSALLSEVRDAAATLEGADRRRYPGWFRALLVKVGREKVPLRELSKASGVTVMTLEKWLRESAPSPSGFRMLKVLESDEEQKREETPRAKGLSGIEIHFPEGLRLTLPEAMASSAVAALVAELRGGRP